MDIQDLIQEFQNSKARISDKCLLLENTLFVYCMEIADLRKKLAERTKECETLRNVFLDRKGKMRKLEEQVEELQEKLKAAQWRIENSPAGGVDFETLAAAKKSLLSENSDLKNQFKSLREQYTDMKAEKNILRLDNAKLRELHGKSEAHVQSLVENASNLLCQLEKVKKENSALKTADVVRQVTVHNLIKRMNGSIDQQNAERIETIIETCVRKYDGNTVVNLDGLRTFIVHLFARHDACMDDIHNKYQAQVQAYVKMVKENPSAEIEFSRPNAQQFFR